MRRLQINVEKIRGLSPGDFPYRLTNNMLVFGSVVKSDIFPKIRRLLYCKSGTIDWATLLLIDSALDIHLSVNIFFRNLSSYGRDK
jgi:hypothetical protein